MFTKNPFLTKPVKIDVKDQKILTMLGYDSRTTIQQISKKVQLQRDTVKYRMTRLEKEGVIKAYIPEAHFQAFHYRKYTVFFSTNEKLSEETQRLITYLQNHDHTVKVVEYLDKWDIQWSLLAHTVDEFDRILQEILSEFTDVITSRLQITHVTTYFSELIPDQFDLLKPTNRTYKQYDVDQKDKDILLAIKNDSRKTIQDIHTETQIAPETIRKRVKALDESGAIEKYTIDIDFPKIGIYEYTVVFQTRGFTGKEEARFAKFVKNHPNIAKAYKTIGQWDIVISILASHRAEFRHAMGDVKEILRNTMTIYDTYIVTKRHPTIAIPKCLLR